MPQSEFTQSLDYPKVAVVVPILNERSRLPKLIGALRRQEYPREKMEVLFVDNGSKDGSVEYLIESKENVMRSMICSDADAARNLGWRACHSEIIAFTDADCIPEPSWLKNLVHALISHNAKCAAGPVILNGPIHSIWQTYESHVFLDQAQSISDRGVAFTANLVARRYWLAELHGFQEGLKSGGDYYFTKKSTSLGHRPIYASDAIVYHPNRKAMALLRKSYRIGWSRGQSFRRTGYLEKIKTHHFSLRHLSHKLASPMGQLRRTAAMAQVLLIMLAVGLSSLLGFCQGFLCKPPYSESIYNRIASKSA